ncbi:MAG: trypsin-like peptidase domain-containing protein, partial [Terriglobia bacterium]
MFRSIQRSGVSHKAMKAQVNVRRYGAVLVIAATLGIGILIGTFASHGVRAARMAPAAPGAEPIPLYSPVRLSESFAAIAAKVSPEVVNINTESTIRFADKGPDAGPYGQFFNHFFHFGPDGPPHDMRQQSLGSGVILDSHGYVLTNYHVVTQDDGEPVDSVRVFLHDQDEGGRGYAGRIIGKDKWTDLAVIKVDAPKPLPAAQLGDSDAMNVGDWVLAIGSPFGLSATVTAGIISAKGRQIEGGSEGEFKHFLQTDAAINPGNSGGPLVNLGGQVIGINTAIATTHGAYDGVGFAIPSKVVRRIYNSLVATGTVRRGAIGVSFVNDENGALLRSFGADHGVVVQSVEAGGPAEGAGIERGDVITAINSKPVHNGNELLSVVSNTGPGSSLRLAIIRDRRPMTRTIVVGDWNKVVGEAEGAPSRALPSGPESSHGSLGVTLKDLDPADAKELSGQLHLSHSEGVMVVDVAPGGF